MTDGSTTLPASLVVLALASACSTACSGGSGAGPPDARGPFDAIGLEAAPADVTAVERPADADPQPFQAIAPCQDPASYAGGSAVAARGVSYLPPCLRVAVGSAVTIEASAEHPLEPRPVGGAGIAGNPIPQAHDTTTIIFPAPGFFPYQCPEHVDSGMLGVIWVQP